MRITRMYGTRGKYLKLKSKYFKLIVDITGNYSDFYIKVLGKSFCREHDFFGIDAGVYYFLNGKLI